MESEKETKLLTVILPVLNREDLLPRTLQSIARQSLTDFDLIIVDNGSEDGTLSVIEKWLPKFSEKGINAIATTESRRGAGRARNKGLTLAETRWVMFFDSDDEMEPNHIKTINDYLNSHPETDLVWFDIKEMDDDGWTTVRSVDDSNIIRGHLLHATLSCARFAVRTELLRKLGGFDESLSAWEDLELGVRLLTTAENARKLNCEPGAVIHPHSDSITGSSYSSKRESLERAMDLCEEALRRAGRYEDTVWVDVKRMIVAGHYYREGEKKLSEKLSDMTLEKTSRARRRIALGFVRDTVSYFGRGGCAIAKALIRTDKGMNEEK